MNRIHWNDKRRTKQRIKPLWKEKFPDYIAELEKRMKDGHREYGDRSFDRPLWGLLEEIQQEVLDQANWGFFCWDRIQELKEKVKKLEEPDSVA